MGQSPGVCAPEPRECRRDRGPPVPYDPAMDRGAKEAPMEPKERAGRKAAEWIEDGMTVGLGTGSTVYFTLVALGERVAREGLSIRGVPTSVDTQRKARELGIPLVGLDEVEAIDVTVDGADEIDPAFDMIKGGGGALLREKVVASISRREVIVVGPGKQVERLGRSFALPVEVVPFARPVVERALRALGLDPRLRRDDAGAPRRTDNGNEVLDCASPDGIADAPALERALAAIPGVVESGLFIGLAHVCVACDADGSVAVSERPA